MTALATTRIARRQRTQVGVPGLDRVVWQRLHADGAHATVSGVRHRRPVRVSVGADVALLLREAGVPTVRAPERVEHD